MLPEIMMANLYRDLFSVPGTGHFAIAGLLARIPLPMAGIGIHSIFAAVRWLCAGRSNFRDLCSDLRPAVTADLPICGSLWAASGFACGFGYQWHRLSHPHSLLPLECCQLGPVFRRIPDGVYAQYVCHGTGTLDGAVPGPAAFADSLFA